MTDRNLTDLYPAPFNYNTGLRAFGIDAATPSVAGLLSAADAAWLARQPSLPAEYVTALTFNLAVSSHLQFATVLGGDIAITLQNGQDGDIARITTKQDATGHRNVTFTASGRTVKLPTGSDANLLSCMQPAALVRWTVELGSAGGVSYVLVTPERFA